MADLLFQFRLPISTNQYEKFLQWEPMRPWWCTSQSFNQRVENEVRRNRWHSETTHFACLWDGHRRVRHGRGSLAGDRLMTDVQQCGDRKATEKDVIVIVIVIVTRWGFTSSSFLPNLVTFFARRRNWPTSVWSWYKSQENCKSEAIQDKEKKLIWFSNQRNLICYFIFARS